MLVALGTLVALSTAACGEPLPEPRPGASPAAYSGLPVTEERIDYAIGKVSDIVTEELDTSGIPGAAVAVVHDDEVAYSEGFGDRNAETGEPVDTGTVFPLASISKSVSATVVAAATAESEVNWSTPVQEHLPWFELSDPQISSMVTVGDLFAHRSGLPEHAGDELEDVRYDRLAILHGLRHLPLEGFRDTYAYTNFGLTAGAEAVAAAAGMPWAELARERIFDPLDMIDTTYSHDNLLEHSNHAVGHVRGAGASDDAWVPASPGRDPDAQAPAGGLSSSVSEMARWMMMVLADGDDPGGSEIVPVEALREALTPQITSAPPTAAEDRTGSYGYGFTISDSSSGRVQWGHSGAFLLGAGTAMLMMPSLDLGIVTLTNASPVGAAETINARFADLAQYGDPTIDWSTRFGDAFAPMLDPVGDLADQAPPVSPADPRPLDELVGTYANDYFGQLNVRRDGDDLLLEPGRVAEPWVLEHWDGDTYAASPTGENWPVGTRGSVVFDDDEVTVDLLNRRDLGTFTRVDDGGADANG